MLPCLFQSCNNLLSQLYHLTHKPNFLAVGTSDNKREGFYVLIQNTVKIWGKQLE